jgi:lysine 2,3-aminomutase
LSDERIEWLLTEIFSIPHIEMVRIGTKVPVVLPQRITPNLIRILKRFKPLYMSVHCTHPDEITKESSKAFNKLADAGIVLGSQSVLLKGVNDSVETLTELYHQLLKVRVKPYYLFQCDPITGSEHFRTTVAKGKELIQGLRGFTSGYAIPQYVIDTPGGGGKVPILPDYEVGHDADNLYLRNYEGKIFAYPDCSKEGTEN